MMKSKIFCIVDPNLQNLIGHYFEYNHSLMKEVRRRGYQFLVLGHRKAEKAILDKMPIRRVFRLNMWQTVFPFLRAIPRLGRRIDLLATNIWFFLILCLCLPFWRVNTKW